MAKYLDFVDIFFKKLATKLLKYLSINKYTISLEKNKQLSYKLIYNLGLIKLKTFKAYIMINLSKSFIQPSQSSTKVFILFLKKSDRNHYLYINY